MTKGKALRFIGGFCLAFGLVTLLSPGSDVHRQVLVLLAGIFLSIFGMSQP